jgi:hypothetical protein
MAQKNSRGGIEIIELYPFAVYRMAGIPEAKIRNGSHVEQGCNPTCGKKRPNRKPEFVCPSKLHFTSDIQSRCAVRRKACRGLVDDTATE